MMYAPVKVNVVSNKHDKLKNAIAQQKATTIRLNLDGGGGENHILL